MDQCVGEVTSLTLRQFAKKVGCSRNEARASLRELERLGLIKVHWGDGPNGMTVHLLLPEDRLLRHGGVV